MTAARGCSRNMVRYDLPLSSRSSSIFCLPIPFPIVSNNRRAAMGWIQAPRSWIYRHWIVGCSCGRLPFGLCGALHCQPTYKVRWHFPLRLWRLSAGCMVDLGPAASDLKGAAVAPWAQIHHPRVAVASHLHALRPDGPGSGYRLYPYQGNPRCVRHR